MPFNLGMGEVLVILVVALLVFGGRLPEVGRSLGRGVVEFKKGLKGLAQEASREDEDIDEDALGGDDSDGDAPVEKAPSGNGDASGSTEA